MLQVYIALRSLSNGLKALGLIKSFSDLFTYEKSGLNLNERGSFKVYQLVHPQVFSGSSFPENMSGVRCVILIGQAG